VSRQGDAVYFSIEAPDLRMLKGFIKHKGIGAGPGLQCVAVAKNKPTAEYTEIGAVPIVGGRVNAAARLSPDAGQS
jgi:hypothetical protein